MDRLSGTILSCQMLGISYFILNYGHYVKASRILCITSCNIAKCSTSSNLVYIF